MAYCKQCGAYIPEGRTTCLACGFDEDEGPNAAAAAQQAKTAEKAAEETQRLRRQMEEQRARQQEQSKKWAQQEAQRRQTQQNTTGGTRGTKIPYSPQGDKTKRSPGVGFSGFTGSTGSSTGTASFSTSKVFAIMSYFSALCFIPLFVCKDDEFAMFHAKQGLALFIAATVGNILGMLLGIGWLFTVAQVFLAFKGIVNAIDGKTEPLPYVGTLFKF